MNKANIFIRLGSAVITQGTLLFQVSLQGALRYCSAQAPRRSNPVVSTHIGCFWIPFIPNIDTTGIVEDNGQGLGLPVNFEIYQNYPNPFNQNTAISYRLSAISSQQPGVRLKIYTILGQEVETLVDREQASGSYSIRWDGRDELAKEVTWGIYFCRLQVIGDGLEVERTRKMVPLR